MAEPVGGLLRRHMAQKIAARGPAECGALTPHFIPKARQCPHSLVRLFPAIGIEEINATSGTVVRIKYLAHIHFFQLYAVGCHQVQPIFTENPVHGVASPSEMVFDLGADPVAAFPNARSQGYLEILARAARDILEFLKAFLQIFFKVPRQPA